MMNPTFCSLVSDESTQNRNVEVIRDHEWCGQQVPEIIESEVVALSSTEPLSRGFRIF